MRPLGHEHDGTETQGPGLFQEFVETQTGLSPKAGVADGVQGGFEHEWLPPGRKDALKDIGFVPKATCKAAMTAALGSVTISVAAQLRKGGFSMSEIATPPTFAVEL